MSHSFRSYILPILVLVCIITIVFFNSLSVYSPIGVRSAQQIIFQSRPSDCNCKLDNSLPSADHKVNCSFSSQECKESLRNETMKEIMKEACPEQKVVEVYKVVKEEPWWAEGKVWHYPSRFPRCSMDSCFNYSRCDGMEEMLVYSYDSLYHPPHYFAGINTTKWHTSDPNKACLFFFFLDCPSWACKIDPLSTPFWNGGMNHVLITFADLWRMKGPPDEKIGFASIMASDLHETTHRSGFDISLPLPPFLRFTELQSIKPFERQYFLTFRGLRYVGNDEGTLRSLPSFREMHNGKVIIVATSCSHPIVQENIRKDASLGAFCDEDEKVYANYSFKMLMNTTFGLCPAGIQPNSYRLLEVLSAGVIPVIIVDNYVKPFDALIQWHLCLLQFPSGEMHRIVPTLRSMNKEDVERRQVNCLHIYESYFASNELLLESSIRALKVRFMGAFSAF